MPIDMIDACMEYAQAARSAGRPVVGILCEYAPRELIMAAGGVPVCLCGGSAEMIGPAEEHLPANLCPLIKSTFGYHLTGENPFLEMADLVVAETTCDGKKKMYELMGQSRPMYVLELPHKSTDPDALDHWRRELRKFQQFLENRYGRPITPQALREAIAQTNRYRALRRRLWELLACSQPPLSGRDILNTNSLIWCIPADEAQCRQMLQELPRAPKRADLAGRVRVLLTGVPILHGADKVPDIIESAGGMIVCLESCSGIKAVLDDVDEQADDPIDALARRYLQLPCACMTPNDRRLELLRQLAERYRPDCVIDLVWQACLTYDVESVRVRRLVEQELDLPYLHISTDYSPGDSARIALRVEALLETARARRK